MNTPAPRNAALKATGMRRRYCPETEVTALTAERDYNHECISRLASATGTLGEKSERVVEVAISTIAALRAEVEESKARERAAIASWDEERQRALREGGRVVELRAELATCKDASESLIESLRAEVERLTKQRDNLLKPMRDQAIARAERAEADADSNRERALTLANSLDEAQAELADDAIALRDMMSERDAAEAELATERARLRRLALDACRDAAIVPLVWYPTGYYVNPNDLGKINKRQVDACVAAIDAAMKEETK